MSAGVVRRALLGRPLAPPRDSCVPTSPRRRSPPPAPAVVHEKYLHRRNAVSFATISFLSVVSALTFTHGMAWMQTVWRLHILADENTLMIISFFAWLLLCGAVHALFLWHTLRTEEGDGGGTDTPAKERAAEANNTDGVVHTE